MSQPRPAASASTNVFLVQFLNRGNQEKSQITQEFFFKQRKARTIKLTDCFFGLSGDFVQP